MKNSHKITILLGSLVSFVKAHALTGYSVNLQTASEPSVVAKDIAVLFKNGILNYEPETHTIRLSKENLQIISPNGNEEDATQSIHEIFGSDVKVNIVPSSEMHLSSQDRQM